MTLLVNNTKRSLLAWLLLLSGAALSAETPFYELQPAKISGSRLANPQATRPLYVNEEIDATAAPQQLFNNTGSVDLLSRGPGGVTSDISIRGANYQQVLVLLDGFKLTDPQTAHHNMDLPVPSIGLGAAAIAPGQGSSIFGSGAFGGTVNALLKHPVAEELNGAACYSSFNTLSLSGSYGNVFPGGSLSFSAANSRSDGFRADTDYNISSFSSCLLLGESEVVLGVTDKQFGAYDFYTPGLNLPSRERTTAYFAGLKGVLQADFAGISGKASVRRHDDAFILDQSRPSYFSSQHISYNLDTEVSFAFKNLPLSAGSEFQFANIDSSAIGRHQLYELAFFTESGLKDAAGREYSLSARADSNARGTRMTASAAVKSPLASGLTLALSAGSSFRDPSFTELYYKDPVNTGNASLSPETAVSGDISLLFDGGAGNKAGLSFFARSEADGIDWVSASPFGPWSSLNTSNAQSAGIEFTSAAVLLGARLSLNFSLIDMKKELPYFAKYSLMFPKRQGTFKAGIPLPLETELLSETTYKERYGAGSYIITNLTLTKKLGNCSVYIRADNLGDMPYQEVFGLPMPGRTISTGLSANF